MMALFRCALAALLSAVLLMPGAPLRAQQSQQVQPAASPFPPAPSPQQAAAASEAPAATDGGLRPLPALGRLDRDMSPWTMFLSADILVKAVMISLVFASLVTWTIFLAKSVQLALARRRLTGALARVTQARTLAEAQMVLGSGRGVLSEFLAASIHELRMSADIADEGGIKERVASSLLDIARIEARSVRHGMSVLATIGATAPFVGLFGTVWGIMNSFIGISKAQTTNLAVVAPGIAEALLATAIGLIAAIPAVMIYNHFSRATKGYVDLVGRASGQVGRLLSRDLDRADRRTVARAAE